MVQCNSVPSERPCEGECGVLGCSQAVLKATKQHQSADSTGSSSSREQFGFAHHRS